MSTTLTYPSEHYVELFLELYDRLNGPESIGPPVEQKGRGYEAKIWSSRGDVLEKAGIGFIDFHHYDRDNPRFVRHFETVIHPHNPRVPGFVVIVGEEYAVTSERRRIYCLLDMWRTTRGLNTKLVNQFRQTVQAVCYDHGRSYVELQGYLPEIKLFGSNGCDAGLFFPEFGGEDIPFLDRLIRRVVEGIQHIIPACHHSHPNVQDFQERNEIRREFLVWALGHESRAQRAVLNGLPWSVLEAVAFPPEVFY